MALKTLVKTVAAAGTPEALTSTRTMCDYVNIQVIGGDSSGTGRNTTRVWVGDSTVTNAGNTGYCLDAPTATAVPVALILNGGANNTWDLSEIFVAVKTNGEGVVVTYNTL